MRINGWAKLTEELSRADAAIKAGHNDLQDKAKASLDARDAQSSISQAQNDLNKLNDPVSKAQFSSNLDSAQSSLTDLKKSISQKGVSHQNDPITPKAPWELAQDDLLAGNWPQAIADSQKAPDDPKALAISAIARWREEGQDTQAQADLTAAKKIDPADPTANALIESADGFMDTSDGGILKFNAAIQTDPSLALPYILKIRRLIQNLDLTNSNNYATTQAAIKTTAQPARSFADTILNSKLITELPAYFKKHGKDPHRAVLAIDNTLKPALGR